MPRRNIFPRLKGELENRIHQLSPGDMLPGENALAAEFGVSRPTLRRALAELEAEGVIDRRNGVGTVVRSVPGPIRREIPFVCGSIDFFSQAIEHFCRRAVELNCFPLVIPLTGSAVAQERLLSNIITGVIPGTEAVGSAADLHIDLIARYYTVLVSELQCSAGKGMDCFVEAKTRLLQISENNTKVISFFVSPERAVFILKNSRLENVEEESYNLANNVEHEVCSDPELSVVTAIGSTVDRITAISESYRSAMDLLRRSRFSGKSRILNAGDCAEDAAPAAGLQENDPLLERIRYADEREIVLIVEQYLSYINESHEEFTAAASYLLVDVIMSISKLAEDLGGDIRDVVPDILSRTFVTNAVRSREVFAAEMERVLRTVLLWRNSRTQGRYADVILRAKKYIGEHFSDPDICLLSTAKAVNMSPNHFSSVFSQECGMTYIEYLTSVRIDTAKKLLRNTSMRSSEIAYETGFSDPHYFSFIFKKNTGQSPQEFRGKKE